MLTSRFRLLRMRVLARRHPSAWLLAAQLASLIAYPLFDESRGGRVVFGAIGAMLLMLVLWVVRRSPAVTWVAWLLAIPAFGASMLAAAIDSPVLLALSSSLEALLYFYAAASLIAYLESLKTK